MYTSPHTVLHGLAAILFLKHIYIYMYTYIDMSYVQENAAGNYSLAICSRKQLETICNIDFRVPANVNNYIYIYLCLENRNQQFLETCFFYLYSFHAMKFGVV